MTRWLCSLVFLIHFGSPLQAQATPEALQDAFFAALTAGDLDALADLYSSDAQLYPVTVMSAQGKDGVRVDWGPFLEAYTITEIEAFQQDEEIFGDTAVAWGLWAMTFVPKDGGDPSIIETRFMDISKKIDEKWYYVVDHASVPFVPPAE